MIALAADFGGTRIKIGVVQDDVLVASDVLTTQTAHSFPVQLTLIAEAFRTLCARCDVAVTDCAGLGVSFPSIVDPADARIHDEYGKFRDAVGFDLRGWARRALNLPLAIENDARTALLGEWHYGAGRQCDNLVMITLGTGIGSATVIEGRLLRGAHHQAACLAGHSTLNLAGPRCGCGNIGCAESEASTAILPQLARARPDFARSQLAREDVLDYAAVFRTARAGDACALALRDHSLRARSATVVNLIHAYDPEKVIVGGGIMAAWDEILPFMRTYVQRHARTPWGQVQILPSALRNQAGLLGCNHLVKTQCT